MQATVYVLLCRYGLCVSPVSSLPQALAITLLQCIFNYRSSRFPAAPTFQDTREAWREEGGKTSITVEFKRYY